MPTLKELMGDSTRGDGRKFRKNKWFECYSFEPIFQEFEGDWFGVDQDGFMQSFCDNDSLDWEPYIESKPKKKVTLYRPIAKEGENYILYDRYCNNKNMFKGKIVGWQQIEVEVDE